jgi:hypothetical protein
MDSMLYVTHIGHDRSKDFVARHVEEGQDDHCQEWKMTLDCFPAARLGIFPTARLGSNPATTLSAWPGQTKDGTGPTGGQ